MEVVARRQVIKGQHVVHVDRVHNENGPRRGVPKHAAVVVDSGVHRVHWICDNRQDRGNRCQDHEGVGKGMNGEPTRLGRRKELVEAVDDGQRNEVATDGSQVGQLKPHFRIDYNTGYLLSQALYLSIFYFSILDFRFSEIWGQKSDYFVLPQLCGTVSFLASLCGRSKWR